MRLLALCLIGTIVFSCPAAAQNAADLEAIRASKRISAVRITQPIVIDGALDDAAWATAQPAGDFYQQFPDQFAPASERTEVRFLYDGDTLYIGAMMYDD